MAALKRFKNINEDYEMDLDRGDTATEHAMAVVARSFELMKKDITSDNGEWPNISAALDSISDEHGLEEEGDSFSLKDATLDMTVDLLTDLLTQAKKLQK